MNPRTKYVVDSSIFIEAKNHYYAFDIAPGFWDSIAVHAKRGSIECIDRIRAEIEDGNDDLAAWIRDGHIIDRAFPASDSEDVLKAYQEIIVWVQSNPQFTPAAKAEFANAPDGWLIAYAKAKGYTVVTQEKFRPDAKRRVFIPNVCRHFNIECVDVFEMLRALGVKFTTNGK